jgi:peptidyl-prolyl cis-trans isomerase A (cyclophilin A)
MRKMIATAPRIFLLSVFIVAIACLPAHALGESKKKSVHVIFTTDLGTFEVSVDMEHAPLSAANFLRYVDGGFYNGGIFHRTVKLNNQPDKKVLIEVVQAGADPKHGPGFPAIPLERTNRTGLLHRDGTISMARDAADTATSDFFICINDQSSLDFGGQRNPDGQGFAAFGKVVSRMDVIRKIQAAPADGQKLTPPVRIISAKRKVATKTDALPQ